MGMQYNTHEYNTQEYNQGLLLLILSDIQASTDSKNEAASITKTEAVTLLLALFNFFNQAALTEGVTLSDVETIQDYVAKLETITMVDSRLVSFFTVLVESLTLSDLRLMQTLKPFADTVPVSDVVTTDDQMSKSEILGMSDALLPFAVGKRALDAITISELQLFAAGRTLSDFQFMVDLLTKQVTAKVLGDSLRVNAWLELRKQAANIWTSLQ
jgi:hypothetical protein